MAIESKVKLDPWVKTINSWHGPFEENCKLLMNFHTITHVSDWLHNGVRYIVKSHLNLLITVTISRDKYHHRPWTLPNGHLKSEIFGPNVAEKYVRKIWFGLEWVIRSELTLLKGSVIADNEGQSQYWKWPSLVTITQPAYFMCF